MGRGHIDIAWEEGMTLGIAYQDEDHRDAVAAISELAAATGAARVDLFRAFISHCEEHFAREEKMMVDIGFFALAPHTGEHRRVLDEMRHVQMGLEAGNSQDLYFSDTLPQWFLDHLSSMDAVTANAARQRGYKG